MSKQFWSLTVMAAFCFLGCWESDSPYPEIESTDSSHNGYSEEKDHDVSCYDLSPCVVSDVSGYQCPGAVNGVACWNFGNRCNANYLCASTRQACLIVCNKEKCGISGSIPYEAVCN